MVSTARLGFARAPAGSTGNIDAPLRPARRTANPASIDAPGRYTLTRGRAPEYAGGRSRGADGMTRSRALWTSAAALALAAVAGFVVVPQFLSPDADSSRASRGTASSVPSDGASGQGRFATATSRPAPPANAAHLRFLLAGPAGGPPPAGVRVVLVGADADGQPTTAEAAPDATGVVQFADIVPGDGYSLRIQADHGSPERRIGPYSR